MGRSVSDYDAELTESYKSIYRDSSLHWLLTPLEDFVCGLLPGRRDIAVLDVACGVGSYCRRLSLLGYRNIVGTDLSQSQIAACISLSKGVEGIQFAALDARKLSNVPEFCRRFDVVNASWLYDSMLNENELQMAVNSVRYCLKSGGIHTGITINFDIRPSYPAEWKDFGISLLFDKPENYKPSDGEILQTKLDASGSRNSIGPDRKHGLLKITSCYYSEATYRRVFAKAGFKHVIFFPARSWQLPISDLSEDEHAKIRRYVKTNPEMIGFLAVKS